MATKKNTEQDILQGEREFIHLLLHNLNMVARWIDSDIKIEYFHHENHLVLQEIVNSYNEGFPLTRKTFKEHLKSISVPKDRIKAELAFNSCSINSNALK